MASQRKPRKISEQQKQFCSHYARDWNATQAYMKAYPKALELSARSRASKLLTKDNIQEHIEKIKKDVEKECGISKQMVVEEVMKMAFSSIAHLHDTWIDLKEFEKLTDEQKQCIESIETKSNKVSTKRTEDGATEPFESETEVFVEQVKIKLHSKSKAIEILNKMLGYNAADKVDHTTLGKEIGQVATFQLPQNGRDANPDN